MTTAGRRRVTLLALLLLVLATALVPTRSSAATDWWTPAARPSPDVRIDVTGEPFTGTNAAGEVRGFVDAHNHLFSNEAFGGRLICGKVFSEAGVADALKDCPEHYPDGTLAIFDYITHGGDGKHDPTGWPTFKDWPAYDSMTHQANYYAWVERAWRGGQRVLVNDLVTNGVICSVYFFKDRSCDEMTSIRLQAKLTYDLQAFIDRQYGGTGKGWFRVVTDSAQARKVIEQGKLAVILGVETSEPFGCKQVLDIAQCSKADIDKGLDELYALGVRSMFLCHKFDNALCGVRFDEGGLGTAINVGQFLSTGTFWQTEKCTTAMHDNPINGATSPAEEELPDGVEVPDYVSDAQCNKRGLTELGEYAVRGMMQREMMLEIDHMSVKATGRVLDIFESASYPGVLSSHSWMDLKWTERVYALGGFVAQYMHGTEEFVKEAGRTDALREKYGVGYGFGTDFNGVGSHPGPRGETASKVTYPFTSVDGGSVIDRQTSGQRTFDINTDGAAHAGMIPDWIEDIRRSGGQDAVGDLFRGAESYLGTWGATEGHQAGVNLARTGTATATATFSESNPFTSYQPDRAIDGDPATRWASDWSDDQSWQVDLGATHLVSRVTLDWERAYGKAYRIDLSPDGVNWRTAWSTSAGDGGLDTARFTATPARHVRVQGLQRGTQWGYSLYEVGVHSR